MSGVAAQCRSCGEGHLIPVLSLGRTPLANALLTAEQLNQPEDHFPLELAFCPTCALVQITEIVPPEKMFRDYLYFSSFSDTMLRHAEAIASQMVAERGLGPDNLVVEVASNDGYLLQFYKQAGVPVLGIEPATNIAKVAEAERGIPTISEFFGEALATQLRSEGRRADVMHANNVLAHVPDLNGFVAGFKTLLSDNGVAVIEAPYVKEMIDRCEFDTIYHEHLCYFSLTTLTRLFERHGLQIFDVALLPIHGGSLRLFVRHHQGEAPGERVRALLAEEADWGVDSPEFYLGFADKVAHLRDSLAHLIGELKASGHRLAAYGAAAKGSTLLNSFGIGRDTLDFVVDRSTYKQGRYMPGVHLPIYSPDHLLTAQPDYVLLLTWNFADEIMAQQAEYRARGGRFIVPIPELRVV